MDIGVVDFAKEFEIGWFVGVFLGKGKQEIIGVGFIHGGGVEWLVGETVGIAVDFGERLNVLVLFDCLDLLFDVLGGCWDGI